jgi:hypothetical protein
MAQKLQEVLLQIKAAAAGPEDDQLFMAAAAGESLERLLADPVELTKTSLRFAEVAHELGCSRVYGASDLGQRLAGAAIALSGNGLKDHTAGMDGQAVLIVDGLLVTGTQVASAARRARRDGAASVCAAVVASFEPDFTQLKQFADQLVVLEG